MLETQNPEIDLAQLLEKIGLELHRQHKSVVGRLDRVASEELAINDPYSWGQLGSTLNVAEQNVNAGAEVTSMLHYRGIMRKIARFLGKVTIFLGRVITIPQRNFNSAILHSFRITLDGIRDMNRSTALFERQIAEQMRHFDEQLKKKSALIDYLKTGLITQERRVSILLEELRRELTTADGSQKALSPHLTGLDILDPLYLAFENQFVDQSSRKEEQQVVRTSILCPRFARRLETCQASCSAPPFKFLPNQGITKATGFMPYIQQPCNPWHRRESRSGVQQAVVPLSQEDVVLLHGDAETVVQLYRILDTP